MAKVKGTKIIIQWRDENYGSVASTYAFRLYCTLTDRDHQVFRGCAKRSKFELNYNRMAWISTIDGADKALVSELEAAGFVVTA